MITTRSVQERKGGLDHVRGVGDRRRRAGSVVLPVLGGRRHGDQVDPVHSTANAIAVQEERELALHVRRNDGTRLHLRPPEPPERVATGSRRASSCSRETKPSVVQACSKTAMSSASLISTPRAWRL